MAYSIENSRRIAELSADDLVRAATAAAGDVKAAAAALGISRRTFDRLVRAFRAKARVAAVRKKHGRPAVGRPRKADA